MESVVLLVMDVQGAIVARFDDAAGYLARVAEAIAAARAAGLPVVYVTIGFRPGHPEISSRNKVLAAAASGAFAEGAPATRIHTAVAPLAGDPVVTRRRVSGFAGSDLDALLSGLGAGTLVLAGIATSGVVLSTVREAADRDYGIVVLADGCLDADPEVHRVLTEKVFPRQAEVRTVAQWAASLAAERRAAPVTLRPVGLVQSPRTDLRDDHWAEVPAVIRLDSRFSADALAGLADFSHLEVVYQFHLVPEKNVAEGARHPRNNPDWPLVGIFAQRGKNRPNRLGVSRCSLVAVAGMDIHVLGLDAVDGTPVLDIKPYLREFAARGEVSQPTWASELMSEYYT